MIDRRQFFRRFGGLAMTVAIAPVDAFPMPELEQLRGPVYGKPFVEDLDIIQKDLNALIHEIYSKQVVAHLRHPSPYMKMWDECSGPAYRLEGEKMVFAVDLTYPDR